MVVGIGFKGETINYVCIPFSFIFDASLFDIGHEIDQPFEYRAMGEPFKIAPLIKVTTDIKENAVALFLTHFINEVLRYCYSFKFSGWIEELVFRVIPVCGITGQREINFFKIIGAQFTSFL